MNKSVQFQNQYERELLYTGKLFIIDSKLIMIRVGEYV